MSSFHIVNWLWKWAAVGPRDDECKRACKRRRMLRSQTAPGCRMWKLYALEAAVDWPNDVLRKKKLFNNTERSCAKRKPRSHASGCLAPSGNGVPLAFLNNYKKNKNKTITRKKTKNNLLLLLLLLLSLYIHCISTLYFAWPIVVCRHLCLLRSPSRLRALS